MVRRLGPSLPLHRLRADRSRLRQRPTLLILKEWYMRPNGQIPAYEWAFGDVNPPTHIAAARALYLDERRRTGVGDRDFLAASSTSSCSISRGG